MSLNQLINPTKPLDVVVNSLSADELTDNRTSIIPSLPALNIGIVDQSGYPSPLPNVSFVVRKFNDSLNGNVCTEYYSEFSCALPENNSSTGLYTLTLGVQEGSIVAFSDCRLFKPSQVSDITGVISVLNPTTIEVSFTTGAPQPASLNSFTKLHFLLVVEDFGA